MCNLVLSFKQLLAPSHYLLLAAVFFAPPDVLSGIFTLASYEEPDLYGAVVMPFSAGCGSIVASS